MTSPLPSCHSGAEFDEAPLSPQALETARLLLERTLLPADCAGALGLTFVPGRGVTLTLGTWAVHHERDLDALIARVVELELTGGPGLVEHVCRAALGQTSTRAQSSFAAQAAGAPRASVSS